MTKPCVLFNDTNETSAICYIKDCIILQIKSNNINNKVLIDLCNSRWSSLRCQEKLSSDSFHSEGATGFLKTLLLRSEDRVWSSFSTSEFFFIFFSFFFSSTHLLLCLEVKTIYSLPSLSVTSTVICCLWLPKLLF